MGKWKTRAAVVCILLFCVQLNAQDLVAVDKQLEVGTKVTITKCTQKSNYISMDLYTKTRYLPNNKPVIDSTTGAGLFEYFFAPGDFDATRLPCMWGGKSYRVAALHILPGNDGTERRIVLLYTPDPLKLIWVELDKAVDLGEITW